ncbi:signal peptidase II [Candidatus Woesearchaeota archaeon]|nr:signal peptidase II [Candidatus Woesearchaeota archaeon]
MVNSRAKPGRFTALVPILAVVALVAADQALKAVVRSLSPSGTAILRLPGVEIVNITNTGTLFGLMRGSSAYLAALAIVAIFVFLFYYGKLHGVQRISAILIISGMAGNTIDRIFRGAVTDFIYVRPWPAFNLADSLLTVGAAFMIASLIVPALKANLKKRG